MIVLSIETSCDDTGVALLDIQPFAAVHCNCGSIIKKGQVKILADFVSSQNEIHAPYGGVVPNLAVRAHYKNLPILLAAAFKKINAKKTRTGSLRSPNLVSSFHSEIDLIAVTNGPGLEPCLWAGVNTARVLARAMKKPLVGVNHLEGHIAANFIGGISNDQFPISKQKSNIKNLKSIFPAICLIVSGGHTQLVLVKDIGKYKIIGQTRDDAAGEAFDKVAKILGLGYPGGPIVSEYAKKGNLEAFDFPRPMIDSNNYDFSFSGLKTAVLYSLKRQLGEKCGDIASSGNESGLNRKIRPNKAILEGRECEKMRHNICASFQQAAVDVLVSKTIRAAVEYKVKTIMLGGGVSANQELRKQMAKAAKISNFQLLTSDLKYCTDNAAMIGLAGYWKFERSGEDSLKNIIARPNLNF